MGPLEAAIEAGRTRLRPIIMTALAMILGMLPMALSSSQNAPLGRAVIGGLMAATLMTLFVVPAIYSIFSRTLVTKKERDDRINAITEPGA
jgi:multidrug efflux pump subunit AcrB